MLQTSFTKDFSIRTLNCAQYTKTVPYSGFSNTVPKMFRKRKKLILILANKNRSEN